MLISHSRRFVYVHVPRTGGSSFASVLRPHVDHPPNSRLGRLVDGLGLRRDPRKARFRAHDPLSKVQQRWPREIFDGYFKFGFVRNPWSWVVSVYHRLLLTPKHRHNRLVSRMSGFTEFVDFEIARAKRFQHTLVVGKGDELLVDYLGRFERLEADFHEVCDRLAIERVELPRLGGRKQVDYREMYDAETRDKVARHWRKDVELFEYEFE